MSKRMQQSTFSIPKMDCFSEESLVRMALDGAEGVHSLEFDLAGRQLDVLHTVPAEDVLAALRPLNLGATLRDTAAVPAGDSALHESIFSIPKMDCSSEENLVRMALADERGVRALKFDLQERVLTVIHDGNPDHVLQRLQSLNLGATVVSSQAGAVPIGTASPDDKGEARTLKLLLAINGVMFVLELALGLVAQSTGLVADSLDMFADAAVYGLALYAVGRAASLKVRAAHIAGWLQVLLALGALAEVLRRTLFGSEPQSALMMGVGLVALAANVTCLMLISKNKEGGAHMKASYIFSANDVIANLGVIAAGVLVSWTGSSAPDLVIGAVIAVVVLNGARRILQLR